jgi:hypothetical protein
MADRRRRRIDRTQRPRFAGGLPRRSKPGLPDRPIRSHLPEVRPYFRSVPVRASMPSGSLPPNVNIRQTAPRGAPLQNCRVEIGAWNGVGSLPDRNRPPRTPGQAAESSRSGDPNRDPKAIPGAPGSAPPSVRVWNSCGANLGTRVDRVLRASNSGQLLLARRYSLISAHKRLRSCRISAGRIRSRCSCLKTSGGGNTASTDLTSGWMNWSAEV